MEYRVIILESPGLNEQGGPASHRLCNVNRKGKSGNEKNLWIKAKRAVAGVLAAFLLLTAANVRSEPGNAPESVPGVELEDEDSFHG